MLQGLYSTRSPFLSFLSQRAQSGRRTSFGRWMWFTESHIVLVIFLLIILLLHFILDINKGVLYPVKQPNNFFIKITQSLVLPPIALECDCFPHWTASVCCPLLTFPHLNLSPYNPSYLSPMVPEHTVTDYIYNAWP